MKIDWLFLLLCTFLFVPFYSAGQCNDPFPPGTGPMACDQAPVFCDVAEMDGYCSSLGQTGFGNCPAPFCGSCENYHFLGFIATSPEVAIQVIVSNCAGTSMGSGIQGQVFQSSNCFSFTAVSNCVSPGVEQDFTLFAANLEFGETYYLMLDGWAADVCDYEINILQGGGPIGDPQIIGDINGDQSTCSGAVETYSVEVNDETTDINWEITPPIGAITNTPDQNSVEITWSNQGTAQVCATPINPCSSGPPVCTQVLIETIPVTIHELEFCLGDSVECAGQTFFTPGVFSTTYDSEDGCDSTVTCIVTAIPPVIVLLADTLCQGECLEVGDSLFCESIVTPITLQTVDGCDSIVSVILTVLSAEATTPDVQEIDCSQSTSTILEPLAVTPLTDTISGSSIQYQWFGPGIVSDPDSAWVEVDQPGTYIFRVRHTLGGVVCSASDTTIVTIPPIITPVGAQICEGETFAFGGELLQENGIYFDTLEAVNNCDSIIELQLEVISPIETLLMINLCEGQTFSVGNSTYNSSGNYADTLVSALGCDSIVRLDLTVEEVILENFEIAICEGEGFEVGDSIYTETGQYTDTLIASFGCDSIIHLDLSVFPNPVVNLQEEICQGDSIEVGDQLFTESGLYEVALSSAAGCDSTVILFLTVYPTYFFEFEETICEGEQIEFAGTVITEAGQYDTTLVSLQGCDSTLSLQLEVLPNSMAEIDTTICEGTAVTIGGIDYSMEGNYTISLISANGCDSIVALDLEVIPTVTESFQLSICQGDSIVWGGMVYSEEGVYADTLVASSGCDSIALLELIVLPSPMETVEAQFCENETFEFGGITYTEGGEYQQIYVAENGCDSIITLLLEELPIQEFELNAVLCPGDTLEIGGIIITESGNYIDTLIGQNGCDSIFSLIVTIQDSILLADTTIIDDNGSNSGSISVDIIGGSPPFSYDWSNGETGPSISDLSAGIYTLTVTDANGCEQEFSFEVDDVSSVSQQPLLSGLKVSPNPVGQSGSWNLSIAEPISGELRINLYDSKGVLLQQHRLHPSGVSPIWNFNAPDIPGVYFVHCQTDQAIGIVRLVVE
jgi:hypothetical protein